MSSPDTPAFNGLLSNTFGSGGTETPITKEQVGALQAAYAAQQTGAAGNPGVAAMQSGQSTATSGGPTTWVATTPEQQILVDAGKTINGERQDQYGSAEDSFDTIAAGWTAYLTATNRAPVMVTAKDAALMMGWLKTAREAHAPKRDNRLDLLGYGAIAERIQQRDDRMVARQQRQQGQ